MVMLCEYLINRLCDIHNGKHQRAGSPDDRFGDRYAQISEGRCQEHNSKDLSDHFDRTGKHGNNLSSHTLHSTAKYEQWSEYIETAHADSDIHNSWIDYSCVACSGNQTEQKRSGWETDQNNKCGCDRIYKDAGTDTGFYTGDPFGTDVLTDKGCNCVSDNIESYIEDIEDLSCCGMCSNDICT